MKDKNLKLFQEDLQLNPQKERIRALKVLVKAKEIEAKRGKKPVFLKKGESRELEFLNKKRRKTTHE